MVRFKAKEVSGLLKASQNVWILLVLGLLLNMFLRNSLPAIAMSILLVALLIPPAAAIWVLARKLRLRAAWWWGVVGLVPIVNWGIAVVLHGRVWRVLRAFGISRMEMRPGVRTKLLGEESPEEEREVKMGFSWLGLLFFLLFLALAVGLDISAFTVAWQQAQIKTGLKAFELEYYETAARKLGPVAAVGGHKVRARLGFSLLHTSKPGSPERKRAVKLLAQEADHDPVAALGLGQAYMNGMEIDRDPRLAERYLRKAVNAGLPLACNELGTMYFRGVGVQRDPKLAFELLQRGADGGNGRAMLNLGNCYANGIGVSPDPVRALDCFRWAEAKKVKTARGYIAQAYFQGTGVEKNVAEALRLANAAAKEDDPIACNLLGIIYMEGAEGISPDVKLAEQYFRRALPGNIPTTKSNLGFLLLNSSPPRTEEGLRLLHDAYEQYREPNAALYLGSLYMEGKGVERNPAKGEELYRQAADFGLLAANWNLALLEIDRNRLDEGIRYLKLAAEQGYPEAINLLGYYYEEGAGVPRDRAKGLELYLKAANLGLPVAMCNVGATLLESPGREAEGIAWLKKAVEKREPNAMNQLAMIYANGQYGTSPDLEKAVSLCREAFRLELPVAAFNLSEYLKRQGKDGEALEALKNGAARNEPNCLNSLGKRYEFGTGVPKDPQKELEYYLKAAKLELPGAMYNAGLALLELSGREAEGVAWLEKAAEQGIPEASNLVGLIYAEGRYGIKTDPGKAEAFYRKALDAGSRIAAYNLYYLLSPQGRVEEAVRVLELGAQQNQPDCLNALGLAYETGRGVPKNSQKSLEYCLKAAELGLPLAMYNTGISLINSPGREAEGVAWLEKAAEQNQEDAVNRLGLIYENGEFGKSADAAKAETYFREAFRLGAPIAAYNLASLLSTQKKYPEVVRILELGAEQGEPNCRNWLGQWYRDGENMPKDPQKALVLFRRAADAGLPEAMRNAAGMLLATENSKIEGIKYLEKAAALNDPEALDWLGYCYDLGKGVPKDAVKAEEYYRRSVALGYLEAFCDLGLLLEEKSGPGTRAEAEKLYREAAEKNYAPAQYQLAVLLGEKRIESRRWLERAAGQGNIRALNRLGSIYCRGAGVKVDYELSRNYFTRAAELGSVEALSCLGYLALQYENKPDEAVGWFRRAAEAGDPDAMVQMAVFCRDGKADEPRNPEKAFEWAEQALKGGNTEAYYFLGQFYEYGIGVDQDLNKALEFYRLSKKEGDKDAEKKVRELERRFK